ncbi:MAG: hypothetical protein QM703_19065 [Gemmatales bacterium]
MSRGNSTHRRAWNPPSTSRNWCRTPPIVVPSAVRAMPRDLEGKSLIGVGRQSRRVLVVDEESARQRTTTGGFDDLLAAIR